MIEVELFERERAPHAPPPQELRSLCERAAHSRGVRDGHVAIELVDSARIAQLNAEHRGKSGPTDVLSFPIDGADAATAQRAELAASDEGAPPGAAPVELGDIVICPQHTADLREAVVHGMLHLLGMDHETDCGEMLALQRHILATHSAARAR
jgi:probable rRNA maturation factor